MHIDQCTPEIIERIPHGIAVTDLEGKLLYINKRVEEITGWRGEDIFTQGQAPKFISASEIEKAAAAHRRCIEQGKAENELQLSKPDGTRITLHNQLILLADEQGKMNRIIHIIHDITQPQKQELNFNLSQHMINLSSDAFFVVDPKSARILDANVKACQALGYTRNELLSLRVIDIQNRFTNQAAWDNYTTQFKDKEEIIVEGDHVRKDGSTFPVEVSVKLATINDTEYFVAIARDITERKRDEEEKQQLQDQLEEYARKLEQRVKRLEKNKVHLSRNEKIVLTAITYFPRHNDQQLSKITRLKRPTITAIRNRLKNAKWFRKINVPNLAAIGCEVLTVFYQMSATEFNKDEHIDQIKLMKECPQSIIVQESESSVYTLAGFNSVAHAHELFADVIKDEKMKQFFSELKHIRFFMPSSTIVRWFDYTHTLTTLFGITFDSVEPRQRPPKGSKLSANQKEVLYALIRHPDVDNETIQELTRLSKPTVIKIKKMLFEKGFLYRVVLPNLKKLRLQHTMVTYKRFTKRHYDRSPIETLIAENKHACHALVDDEQFIMISLHSDYTEREKEGVNIKNTYQKLFNTTKSPHFTHFNDARLVKLDFSPLIKELFSLDIRY